MRMSAASHERVEDGEVVTRVLVADEEKILASESDATKARLSDVVVGWDRGESEEASKLAEVAQQVANGAPESGARVEGMTMPASPPKQPSEEGAGAHLAQREVVRASEDAGGLGPDRCTVVGLTHQPLPKLPPVSHARRVRDPQRSIQAPQLVRLPS
jgi:hypothetical protein